MKRIKGETIFALVILAVFLVLVLTATGYNRKARMLPLVLGIPGIVFGVAEAAWSWKRSPAVDEEEDGRDQDREERKSFTKRWCEEVAWICGLLASIWLFGFILTIPVFVLAYTKRKMESWPVSAAMALGSWGLLYWVFVIGLKIVLYQGLLVEALKG